MGRKDTKIGGFGTKSSTGTLALQTDAEGNLRYDMVLRQGQRDNKIILSQFKDSQARDILDSEDRSKPSEEEVDEVTKKTQEALHKLMDGNVANF